MLTAGHNPKGYTLHKHLPRGGTTKATRQTLTGRRCTAATATKTAIQYLNAGTNLRSTVPSAMHKDTPSEIALEMARRPTQEETPPRVKTKMPNRSTEERRKRRKKMGIKA